VLNKIKELVFASIAIVLLSRSCEGPAIPKKQNSIQQGSQIVKTTKPESSIISNSEPSETKFPMPQKSRDSKIISSQNQKVELSANPIKLILSSKKESTSLILRFENYSPENIYAMVDESNSENVDLEANPIRVKLQPIVSQKKLDDFNSSLTIDNQRVEWVSISSLKKLGYIVNYSEASQVVSISIPPNQKETTKLDILKDKKLNRDGTEKDSFVSGFANFYYNKGYYDGSVFQNSTSSTSPSATYIDSALNIDKFVLESTGSYIQGQGYIRDQLRVVKDDEAHGVRYSVGDVNSSFGGYLTSTTVGGVNVSRQDEITPYKIVIPINETQILVKTRVTLDVVINGFTMYSQDMDAGTYDIRNFPFMNGMNDAQIVVKDYNTKKVIDTVNLATFAYNKRILRKGENYFDYTTGYNQGTLAVGGAVKVLDKFYDTKQVETTLSDSYGLFDRLSVTGYTQFEPDYSMLGLGFAYSSPLGVFTIDNGLSQNSLYGTKGLGTKMQLEYIRRWWNFRLGFEKRFSEFTMMNEYYGDQTLDHSFLGSVGVNLPHDWSVFTSGTLSEYKDAEKTYEIDLGLNKHIGSSIQASVVGTYGRIDLETPQQLGFRLNLTWTFDPRGVAYATTDSITKQDQVKASYSIPAGDNANVDVGGGVSRSIGENDYSIYSDYSNDKGRVAVNRDQLQTFNGTGGVTTVTGETALAFAGGSFAWTRPITNAFVMFKPEGEIKDKELLVDPASDEKTGQAESDFLGTAVMQAVPYLRTKYTVGVPPEFDNESIFLNSDNFDVVSTYKSGTLVDVKADKTATIIGLLIGSNQLPLCEVSGEMRGTDPKDKSEPLMFFTNDKGQFYIQGVRGEEYEITFFNEEETKVKIEIPTGISGKYEMGKVYAPFIKNK
jgi:outer membrane usher protein